MIEVGKAGSAPASQRALLERIVCLPCFPIYAALSYIQVMSLVCSP